MNKLFITRHNGLWSLIGALCAALIALALISLPSSLAHAQEPKLFAEDEPGMADAEPAAEAEVGDEPKAVEVEPLSRSEVNQRTRDYIGSSNEKITINQIVQEMLDDFTADAKELNLAAISPMAIRGVATTPNLTPSYSDWVHSQLINGLARHARINVKRCISCGALTTRIDGEEWVVSLGQTTQEELAAEAKRLGVIAFLDAYLAFDPGANTVSLSIQMYRATDGKVLWSETYMSDATTAAVLRSGERLQTREEAYRELVRKIEEKPYYGYQLTVGMGVIPYDSPTAGSLTGIQIGGRIYEKFGEDKRMLYGLHGESFLNLGANAITGAFVGAIGQYQINQPNLNDPIYRVGGIIQGFIAGTEGNSVAIEANAEAIFQFRLGASLGLMYFRPVTFAGSQLGGFGAKARFLFNW